MGLESPELLKQVNQIARANDAEKPEHALKWATAQKTYDSDICKPTTIASEKINLTGSINYLNPRSIEPEEIYVTPYFATGFHRSFEGLPSTNIATQVDPPPTEGWTWHPIYYLQSLVTARPKGR